MSRKGEKHRQFSSEFKLLVLKDYYAGHSSTYAISKKYGVNTASIRKWLKDYESKLLPLPENLTELEEQVYMGRKQKSQAVQSPQKSELELLREENARLRKALSYSELRNEALLEVIKISSDRHGEDLLKKAGAKQ